LRRQIRLIIKEYQDNINSMNSHKPKQLFPSGDAPKHRRRIQLYPKNWTKIRKEFISKHPLCRSCELFGTIALACEVDHIKPLAKGGEPADENNLQSLCRPCHVRKTAADNKYAPGRGRRMPNRQG
jgi:hypothetical protein